MRILYSRIGHPHCLVCGDEITKLSNEEIKNFIVEKIEAYKNLPTPSVGKRIPLPVYIELYSPVVRGRKGEYYQLLYDLLGKGFSHILVDGVRKSLRDRVELSKTKRHTIDVLVDSISLLDFKIDLKNADERLSEALEKALHESDGQVTIIKKSSH